ncbi:exodeoxyribonuclease VII small subunit [Streptomyces boncukensis]|uniref:Exodeoxyribonuclease 7 small subunit n=1 Tax=Streptomyces boncukensis TaxID=2711219 RepID=A0A6G4X2S9_9ACTN|nr:exodeoxyribonuclease VII small subunit [Streptomyces boncukensis]NGO71563.1 exodeoxyribonuclease VII small subunit [Streptomyces boncukensis]
MTTTETPGGTEESALSYEQARAELIEVVQRLEAGGATLEESLALWERGEELAGICREWLEGARARLDAVLDEDAEDTDEDNDDDADNDDAEADDEDGAGHGAG